MIEIFRSKDGVERKVSDTKRVVNYITKDISPNISLAFTEAEEAYQESELTPYNRIYYILEGKMEIFIDGEWVSIKKDDSCFISAGTEYKSRGKFKALVVNQPAFGS